MPSQHQRSQKLIVPSSETRSFSYPILDHLVDHVIDLGPADQELNVLVRLSVQQAQPQQGLASTHHNMYHKNRPNIVNEKRQKQIQGDQLYLLHVRSLRWQDHGGWFSQKDGLKSCIG